jgi:hypothetical protein
MIVVVDVVDCADIKSGGVRAADGVGGLVKDFAAYGKLFGYLPL